MKEAQSKSTENAIDRKKYFGTQLEQIGNRFCLRLIPGVGGKGSRLKNPQSQRGPLFFQYYYFKYDKHHHHHHYHHH